MIGLMVTVSRSETTSEFRDGLLRNCNEGSSDQQSGLRKLVVWGELSTQGAPDTSLGNAGQCGYSGATGNASANECRNVGIGN